MSDDLTTLEQVVMASLAADRGPVAALRSRSQAARVLIFVAVAAAELALLWSALLRPDFARYPLARMSLITGGYAVLLAVAAWISLRPLYLPERGGLVRAITGLAVLAPLAIALLPELPTVVAPLAPAAHAGFCFADGIVLALPALLVTRILDRSGHQASAAAILAAVTAGTVAILGLHLQCPINDRLHLLLAHGSIPAALLLGTLLVMRRAGGIRDR